VVQKREDVTRREREKEGGKEERRKLRFFLMEYTAAVVYSPAQLPVINNWVVVN